MGLLKKLAKGALKLANPVNAVKMLNPKTAVGQVKGIVGGGAKKASPAPVGHGKPRRVAGVPGAGGAPDIISKLNFRKRV